MKVLHPPCQLCKIQLHSHDVGELSGYVQKDPDLLPLGEDILYHKKCLQPLLV